MPAARTLIALAAGAVLALVAGESTAQSGAWPSRPIRFVVPLPPGGSPDYLSRLLAERLQPALGQPLVVENKPGAGGNIAREFVAKQPADGYTILMSESSPVMAGSSRTAILPDVPTIAEAGPLAGYTVDVWLGVMAPAGTPRSIIDRLNGEINRVVRDPQIVKERLNTVGLEAVGTTPEQLLEVMKTDLGKYAKLAREAQIKPE